MDLRKVIMILRERRNFTDPGKKFIISLHYNGDESYFFVNGRQELKFKAKTDQLCKEKLCIGNLSDNGQQANRKKQGYMEVFMILQWIMNKL